MARRNKRNVRLEPPTDLLNEIEYVSTQVRNFSRRGKHDTIWHKRLAELNEALSKYQHEEPEETLDIEEQENGE